MANLSSNGLQFRHEEGHCFVYFTYFVMMPTNIYNHAYSGVFGFQIPNIPEASGVDF